MKKLLLILVLAFPCLVDAQNFVDPTTPDTVPANPWIGGGWKLDFSDEFNGTAVDATKWNIDNSQSSRSSRPALGINSWFWKPANVEVANGKLLLKVTKPTSNSMYCASINSNGKYLPKFGYAEARMFIAQATKGTHTAFWLQGPNQGNIDGSGADGIEIDIFESAWTSNNTKTATHYDGYGASADGKTSAWSAPNLHTKTHTFGLLWDETSLKIYYDGTLKVTFTDPLIVPLVQEFLWLSTGASFGAETPTSFGSSAANYTYSTEPVSTTNPLTMAQVEWVRFWVPQSTGIESNRQDNSLRVGAIKNGLRMVADETINSYSIFDVYGKTVAMDSINENQAAVALPSGIYIVEAKLVSGIVARKKCIVKN